MHNSEISLSSRAKTQLTKLLAQEENPDSYFRVRVDGGGCAGFQYMFAFDTNIEDDDIIFEFAPVKLAIDETSLELLKDSEIDYVEELVGSRFLIKNPHATSSCGCGTSFSI